MGEGKLCPKNNNGYARCSVECAWYIPMEGKCVEVAKLDVLERIALYLNPSAEHQHISHGIHDLLDRVGEKE